MSPVEILVNEHKIIVVGLDCLVKMVEEGIMMKKLRYLQAEELVNLFRNYADRWHHAKEETFLFEAMKAKKLKELDGHVNDLSGEHTKGRSFVKGMFDSFREAAHGDMAEVMNFAKHARNYLDLLRGHILKEDKVIFPVFDKHLTDDDNKKLLELFATVRLEGHNIMADIDSQYRESARSLAFVFNIPVEGRI